MNAIIKWWVTAKLPLPDILATHASKAKNPFEFVMRFVSQWFIHPVKRRVARLYLKILQRFTDIKVIGITGSTGKTTTTEMLGSILSGAGKTVWSKESVDPVYNIPNTILRTPWGTKYLILEMSVEYPGEMDYYLWLSQPDVGVVTNISTTHTLYLQNKKGVAREKGKLIKSLPKNGYAILNREDDLVSSFKKLTQAKVVWFGEGSDIFAEEIKLNKDMGTSFTLYIGSGKKSVHIPAFGKQFVLNALASSAAAYSLGVVTDKIGIGIERFNQPSHRLRIIMHKSGAVILDDSYNSNPRAASESLETFSALAGRKEKIAVIGDMLELGEYEEKTHRDLGKKIGRLGFKFLIAVGNASKYVAEETAGFIGNKNCRLVSDQSDVFAILMPLLRKNTAVFIKGSRSIGLDRIVARLS